MSKIKNRLSYGNGYVINENAIDYVVGRVLTIIEALGLKDSQEESLKDLIKNELYEVNRDGLWLPPVFHDAVRDAASEMKLSAQKKSLQLLSTSDQTVSYDPTPQYPEKFSVEITWKEETE